MRDVCSADRVHAVLNLESRLNVGSDMKQKFIHLLSTELMMNRCLSKFLDFQT